MIFYDLDFEFPEAKKIDNLRPKTGADIIISDKGFPFTTEAMIKKHIESGCILYRVISSKDLLQLSDELILFNLRKILMLGAKSWQAVLLFDDERSIFDYEKYVRKIDLWIDHGGIVVGTYGNPLRLYITKRESSYLEGKKTQTVLVPSYGPRKEIEVASDWRITLASFPGVGWYGASVIQKIIVEKKLGNDLLTAMWFLTDLEELEKSEGTWRKIREDARKWLGLPDGFQLDLVVPKIEENDGKE